MHPLSFEFKRVHLKCVAFGTRVVESIAHMTPATFDLLFAVRTNFGTSLPVAAGALGYCDGVRQVDLWRRFGLDNSTISKMITRLKKLGWVTNHERDPHDARTRLVKLTQVGTLRIERAMRKVFQQHSHLKKFEGFFKKEVQAVLPRMQTYSSGLRKLAGHLGDTSTPLYAVKKETKRFFPKALLERFKTGRFDKAGPRCTSWPGLGPGEWPGLGPWPGPEPGPWPGPRPESNSCSVGMRWQFRVARPGCRLVAARCRTVLPSPREAPRSVAFVLATSRCKRDRAAEARQLEYVKDLASRPFDWCWYDVDERVIAANAVRRHDRGVCKTLDPRTKKLREISVGLALEERAKELPAHRFWNEHRALCYERDRLDMDKYNRRRQRRYERRRAERERKLAGRNLS